MPRPPKSRQPIKDAALRLFVEHGVHATSIRDIAHAAGCSEAALYRHWQHKEDLVQSLFREHVGEVVVLLDTHLHTAKPVSQRLHSALDALYRLYDQRPHVFRFVLLVQHELGPYLPADTRMPQAVIAEFVEEARAPALADMPGTLLSAALVGTFIECSSRVVYGHLPGPMRNYTKPVTALCLRLLGIRS